MEYHHQLEMCFISENNDLLVQQVEEELNSWFALPSQWFVHSKQETERDQVLLIVTAEIHVKGPWESEASLLDYVEDHFRPELLERLYGYQVKIESNQTGGCCGCGKVG